MITVTIITPDKKQRQAEIDPSASFERIKNDVVRSLKLGDPNDYTIFISPKSKRDPLQNYVPVSGDTIYIVKIEDTGSTSVRFLDT